MASVNSFVWGSFACKASASPFAVVRPGTIIKHECGITKELLEDTVGIKKISRGYAVYTDHQSNPWLAINAGFVVCNRILYINVLSSWKDKSFQVKARRLMGNNTNRNLSSRHLQQSTRRNATHWFGTYKQKFSSITPVKQLHLAEIIYNTKCDVFGMLPVVRSQGG